VLPKKQSEGVRFY